MSKPEFVYTTYIETTPEKLWHALTDGDFTENYWFGHRVTSDWKVGSPFQFALRGKPSIAGKVLVSRSAEQAGLHLGAVFARRRSSNGPHASPSTSNRAAPPSS